MKYALVFDLGTGSVKASLFDENADIVSSVVVNYKTYYDDGGIREQCPTDWWNSICEAVPELLKDFDGKEDIAAIGLSGHSLGIIAVDGEGNLLVDRTPIWSDARAEAQADAFFAKTDRKAWYECTGNGFPAHLYSVFKIMWYKDNMPAVYENAKAFIGTKDYINFMLTGVICTDSSYASGCGVYDLKNHGYNEEYIRLSGVDRSKFPEIRDSDAVIGTVKPELAKAWGIPETVGVVAGGVDNACMSLGAGCCENNDAYVSLGSSAWVAASTDIPVVDYETKIYTWEHCVKGMYVPSAGIFSSGTSLDWVKNSCFAELSHKEFDELAATAPVGANGMLFNPVLSGGSGVDAGEKMQGGFYGFDLKNTRADLARATLEGISYDLSLAVDALKTQLNLAEPLCAVGGGSKSDIWLQIYADILNMDMLGGAVARDAAALGAAALVFVGTGIWDSYGEIKKKQQQGRLIPKNPKNAAAYQENKKRFNLVCRHAAELSEI